MIPSLGISEFNLLNKRPWFSLGLIQPSLVVCVGLVAYLPGGVGRQYIFILKIVWR